MWHLLRIMPYRREGAPDRGFVVTILNVSAFQRLEETLRRSEAGLAPKGPGRGPAP